MATNSEIAILVAAAVGVIAWAAAAKGQAARRLAALTYSPSAAAAVWAADSAFTCPNSVDPAWCIVSRVKAPAYCNADELCAGYVVPSAAVAKEKWAVWSEMDLAQLTRKAPAENAGYPGTVFYAKPKA